jgi:exodeoxyribonuclease III
VLIATWNVNSVRTRLPHILNWLKAEPVDVLCLQETKVVDADFPRSPLEDLGYHLATCGQKSYNGVAILSRQPLEQVSSGFASTLGTERVDPAIEAQKRVITGVINGVRILNLYVPNGGGGDEKFEFKLQWLDLLKHYLQVQLHDSTPVCMCGDFNIALEDRDIHTPEKYINDVMATPDERAALQRILDLGLQDVFRKFTDESDHFSWWDYRAASFRRNLGWRIDHLYLTADLYQQAQRCWIDKTPRHWTQPSDHTPVIVEI